MHGPDQIGIFEVRQAGPCQLADDLHAVLRWFAGLCGDKGQAPEWSDWLREVGPDRQTVTL